MRGNYQTIAGRAFPAGSSRRLDAEIRVFGAIAVLMDDDGTELARSDIDALDIQPRIGTASRRLTFSDGSLFETEDFDAVAGMEGKTAAGLLHRSEAFRFRLVPIAAASLLGAWALWRFALPVLVAIAIWMTPKDLIEAIDRGTLKTVDIYMADPSKLPEKEREEAKALFDFLLAALPEETRDDFSFTLEFRDMPGMGPNAFALPGGTIVLTDAIVKQFPDENILGGVLAHEIGHVVDQHGMQRLYGSVGTYVMIALIAGDTGPILEDILLEGNILLSLSNSRKHEREADAFGIRLAHDAGLDPGGLIEFFDSIPAESDTSWLSTHPGTEERIEAIRDYLETHEH